MHVVQSRFAVARRMTRFFVVYPDGTVIPYKESKCHPSFVPKYNIGEKILGGLSHMATLGISLLFKNSWPGFTNSDEICLVCQNSPGAAGCGKVGEVQYRDVDNNEITLSIDHSNKL